MKNVKISVFKDLFKSQDVPYIIPLEKELQRIKQGKSKEIIEKIRAGSAETAKKLKMKLPSILFSGEFIERNSNGLIQHSGLMVVDFDKYPDQKTMKKHFSKLKKNEHFITLFISPSGNGIKGVVRVPTDLDKESHPRYFRKWKSQGHRMYKNGTGGAGQEW